MKSVRLILLILIVVIVSACHSSKQMLPSTSVIVTNTDSVRTEYIETVRIDTVTVEVLIPMESAMQIVRDSTSHLETNYAESDAWINSDGTLGHRIQNKEKAVPVDVLVPNKTTKTNNDSKSLKEIPVPYPDPVYIEKELSWWDEFRLGAFWYLITAIAGCGIWIFRKQLIKIIRKCISK